MSLTDQELRCIDLCCQWLDGKVGGKWYLPPDAKELAELYPNIPTPEVIVTNGQLKAAIEVKQLFGGDDQKAYSGALHSLRRRLAPSCGGRYWLGTPSQFELPMAGDLMRHLKAEIERVAPTMAPGDTRPIRMPRKARLVYQGSAGGYGSIYCCHSDISAVTAIDDRIEGAFFLADQGLPEHEFATPEGLRDFQDRLVEACNRAAEMDSSQTVEWVEAWPLRRMDDDPEHPDSVWVVAAVCGNVLAAVAECLDDVITNALRKFGVQRWANLHVLALESKNPLVRLDTVLMILDQVDAPDLATIDVVLLIEKGEVSPVWVR